MFKHNTFYKHKDANEFYFIEFLSHPPNTDDEYDRVLMTSYKPDGKYHGSFLSSKDSDCRYLECYKDDLVDKFKPHMIYSCTNRSIPVKPYDLESAIQDSKYLLDHKLNPSGYISGITSTGFIVCSFNTFNREYRPYTFDSIIKNFTFEDGTGIGIKDLIF